MLIRTLDTCATPTPKLLEACAIFGLAIRHTPANPNAARPTLDAGALILHQAALPGSLTLLQGPSGSGKSTLLAAMAAIARRAGHTVIEASPMAPTEEHTSIIDCIAGPLPDTFRTLANAGLADATLFARTPRQLSEGERARLNLARALALAAAAPPHSPITLIVDEFASVLDRTSARCLCHALHRWRRIALHVRLVLATAHEDVRAWLCSDITAALNTDGVLTVQHHPEPTP